MPVLVPLGREGAVYSNVGDLAMNRVRTCALVALPLFVSSVMPGQSPREHDTAGHEKTTNPDIS